jgi:basic membrane protein A and related proteins
MFRLAQGLVALTAFALVLVACAAPTPSATASPKAEAKPVAPATPASLAANTAPAAGPATASPAPAPRSDRQLKVGLVTGVGKIDDKSFNQSAWEGVQRAQRELGASVKFIETIDPRDSATNIDQLVQDNCDVVVTVGFAIGQATQEAASRYRTVKFLGVEQFQDKPTENLAGLIFDGDKAGYLAGALAGLMSESGTVGQVLATDRVPPVVMVAKGYEAGARAVKPAVKVLTAYHPGGPKRGFTDPDWGKATALQMIQQQADVIFAGGGTTGNGGLLGAAERNVLAVGVDTDQWETLPQVRPVLLSSAMKLITPGVFNLIQAVGDGTFQGGNVVGEVGLAPFHDTEAKVPNEIKLRLQQIDRGLKDGSIKTGAAL